MKVHALIADKVLTDEQICTIQTLLGADKVMKDTPKKTYYFLEN